MILSTAAAPGTALRGSGVLSVVFGEKAMEYSLSVNQNLHTQVAVVGGGTAGVFAAIAAAKTGAKTLLIEKGGILGGTNTAAGVCFPGLFHAWGRQIIDGPCWQSLVRAAALGGADIPAVEYQPRHHSFMQVPVNRFLYAHVLDEMCREAGVQVLAHAMPCHGRQNDAGVEILLACKEQPVLVQAEQVIDCTGDANLCGLLGYAMQPAQDPAVSDGLQPATLINDIEGYRLSDLNEAAFRAFLADLERQGKLTPADYQGHDLWHQLTVGRFSMHIAAPGADTSAGKTALEQNARATLARIVTNLRAFPGLEGLRVSCFMDECGVRETNRILGEVTMDVDSYVNATRWPDAVCYAFYPVDRHQTTGIYQIFLQPEKVPTVPYRALLPKGSNRVSVAGRCISCDRDTQSAVRVMAPCMAMGQAAGVAAALAAQNGCSLQAVAYADLVQGLKLLGAIVPE